MLEQILKLSESETLKVVQDVFSYLFGGINKSELRSRINNPSIYKIVNSEILHNGYVLKNCKAYLYGCYAMQEKGVTVPPEEFEILPEDVPYLNRVSLFITNQSCKPLSLNSIDWVVSHVYDKSFNEYIGKYISKKMLFLIHSYGVDRSELYSELQMVAIYAIYKQYPYFVSVQHALNIAKRAIHNRGVNLILFYTRKRRQRLTQTEDGFFSQKNVSLDDVVVPYVDLGSKKREIATAFSQLQRKVGKRGRLFLKLALGEHDAGFSSYLAKNNSDYMESRGYTPYMRKVYKYLGVDKSQVTTFLQKLKPYL